MPRTPPPRTPEQQQEHERRQALTSLDIPALRAWMRTTGLEAALIGDDALILRAAHEVRVVDPRLAALRRESIAWLKEHAPDSTALKAAWPGPQYGRRVESCKLG